MTQDFTKSLLKAVAVIAFVADSIAIFLFVRELLTPVPMESYRATERSLSLAIVILLVFVFSLATIKYSGSGSEWLLALFGIIYSVFAAFILGIATYKTIETSYLERHVHYSSVLAVIVAIFSFVVTWQARSNYVFLSLPYIAVSLLHISYILYVMWSGADIFIGTHLYLLIEISIITFLFAQDNSFNRNKAAGNLYQPLPVIIPVVLFLALATVGLNLMGWTGVVLSGLVGLGVFYTTGRGHGDNSNS